MRAVMLTSVACLLTASQFAPPNVLEDGDARGGQFSWTKNHRPGGQAATETCGGLPCFVVRNHGAWSQFARLPDGSAGKFLLVIGRGFSERVWRDGNITGLPYLNAARAPASTGTTPYTNQ